MKGIAKISDLDQWLAERHMGGHWSEDRRPTKMKPYLWKWANISQGLMKATELVPMDETGRRTIQFKNPVFGDRMTETIHLSVQCITPGEIARAHHHAAGAIRFILEGSPHAYTVVDGERLIMEEGDLVTTPGMAWHDHYNGSDKPIIWLDGLDARLIRFLNAQLTENYHQEQQPVERPDGFSSTIWGHARPSWMSGQRPTPPFRYRWEETYPTLLSLKESEGDPFDGIRLQYVNPHNGGPTLPTFSCEIQLLRPHEKTRAHRHTSTTVYNAFRGTGVTTVGGEKLEWGQRDMFMVPPWEWHHHQNPSDQDSILFSVSDWPTHVALGLYREEH